MLATVHVFAEDVRLTQVAFPLRRCAVFDGLIEHRHQLRAPGADGIKCAGLDQPFQHPLVDFVQIDAPAEIKEGGKASAFGANGQDRFDRTFADVLDRGKAEPDGAVHHRKIFLTLVDVGAQHFDAQIAAFCEIAHDLVLHFPYHSS